MVDRGSTLWDTVEFAWVSDFLDLQGVRSLAMTAKEHPAAEVPFARPPMRMLTEERFINDDAQDAQEFADDYYYWWEETDREAHEAAQFEAQWR